MPYVEIFVAAETLAEESQKILCEGTTRLMVEVLRKRREVTVVQIIPTSLERWFAGGQPLSAHGRAAYAQIKITQGTNSTEEKARFLAEFHVLLTNTLGPLIAPAYVVTHEVPGNDWGYDGISQAQRGGPL